jgi:hypothetical protein
LSAACRLGGAEGGNGRDEVVHVLGLEVLLERDYLAELAGPAWPGVEDGDHRPWAGVVAVNLEAWAIQGFADAAGLTARRPPAARGQGAMVSGSPGPMTLTGTSGARRRAASTKWAGSLSLLRKSMSPTVPPVKA